MRVHVAFTPGEAARVPDRDRGRRAARDVHDRPGPRRRLPHGLLLRRGRGGTGAQGRARRRGPRRRARRRSAARLRLRELSARVPLAAGRGGRHHDHERNPRRGRRGANCDLVLVGSMLNLDAVAAAARERGEDVEVVCAGLRGGPSEDDAYCAGRIAALLGGERDRGGRARPSSWQRPTRLPRRRFAPSEGSGRPSQRKTWSGAHARASARSSLAFDGMRGTAARLVA